MTEDKDKRGPTLTKLLEEEGISDLINDAMNRVEQALATVKNPEDDAEIDAVLAKMMADMKGDFHVEAARVASPEGLVRLGLGGFLKPRTLN